MKLTFLSWRTKAALRKNKSKRASTPWKKSNSIGIVFTVEDRAKHDEVKELVRRLELEGKQVKVLEFLPRKKENFEFLYDFFTVQDLNFWGKIVNKHAEKFMTESFDYLFYADTVHHPLILNILAKSPALCRVGQHEEMHEPYFEMMIGHNGTVKGLIENMYKYVRQLK